MTSGLGQKREKAAGGSNETLKVFTISKKVVLKEKMFLFVQFSFSQIGI